MAQYVRIRVPYTVLESKIEDGLKDGLGRFLKYREDKEELEVKLEHELLPEQLHYVMMALADLFDDKEDE